MTPLIEMLFFAANILQKTGRWRVGRLAQVIFLRLRHIPA